MASSEASRPAAETRDEHELSPVSNSGSANPENIPSPATRSQSGEPGRAPSPGRPAGNPIAQPPPPARQQPYPPPQVPYAPYPYPPQPYPCAQPAQLEPPYVRSWTFSKLVLTILTTIIALVILALTCVLLGNEGGDTTVISFYALPITIVSILWNGAELITYGIRARGNVKRGIHPGAHVGLHLCLWLASLFGILLTVTISIGIQSLYRQCLEDENDRYSYWSYCDDDGSGYAYRDAVYLPMVRAVTSLFCLLTLGHFILFIMACIDTHKRNMMKPAGIVMPPLPAMYYAPPPPPPPGVAPYYPYPIPMQPQPAHFAPAPNGTGIVPPNAPQANAPQVNTAQANPNARNYQNLAGFYAPAPAPAPAQAVPQPSRSPVQAAAGPSNEKAVASTPASPGQAL